MAWTGATAAIAAAGWAAARVPAPAPARKAASASSSAAARSASSASDKIDYIDYKDLKLLQAFAPERGKILPRRMFGTCAEHQRKLTLAIKRARAIALLPYAAE